MKRTLLFAASLVLGISTALVPVVSAQKPERNQNQKATPTRDQDRDKEDFSNMSDQDFITRAATAGMAEVEMSRLAADQAGSADVRKLAQRLAEDHAKANKELMKIASDKNVTLPRQIDKKHQTEIARLAKMRGAEFDHAFVADQVKGHKHAVAMFEHEAKNGKDKDIKAFAEKTLPTLKEHLKMAEELSGGKATEKARKQ